MTVAIARKGRYMTIDGTTSEVLTALVNEGTAKAVGYFVNTTTGARYILAERD